MSQTFTPDVSLRIFAMVVVGGLGSISGAVLGAVFVYGVQYFLPSEYAFLATGAGLLLVLLLVPGGLGAMFGDARDGVLRWYARRKGIRVPSLLADTLVEPTIPVEDLHARDGRRRDARRARDARWRSTNDGGRWSMTVAAQAADRLVHHPRLPVPHPAHAAPLLRGDERRRGAVPADRAGRAQRA